MEAYEVQKEAWSYGVICSTVARSASVTQAKNAAAIFEMGRPRTRFKLS